MIIDICLNQKKSTPENPSWVVTAKATTLRGADIVRLFRLVADQIFHGQPLVFRGERISLTCRLKPMPTDRLCWQGAAGVLRRAADGLAKTPGYAL